MIEEGNVRVVSTSNVVPIIHHSWNNAFGVFGFFYGGSSHIQRLQYQGVKHFLIGFASHSLQYSAQKYERHI